MNPLDTLGLVVLYLIFPYALTLCFVYGFLTAPAWRLAPKLYYLDLNEVMG